MSDIRWQRKSLCSLYCRIGTLSYGYHCISVLVWGHGSQSDKLVSKRPCGPNKRAIRRAKYDLAKNDPGKEPFESLPDCAFGDAADWERNLIQDRVRALREKMSISGTFCIL